MRIRRSRFPRKGGGELRAWCYIADAPRAAVLLCPALAARAGAYDAFCRYLCRRGLSVLVPQYRLDGTPSLRDWAMDDTAVAVRHFLESAGTLRTIAIGHSIGGLFLGLSEQNSHFDRLLLVASPQPNVWTFAARAIPRAALHFYLTVPLFSRFRREIPLDGIGLNGRVPAKIAADCAALIRSSRFDDGLRMLALPATHFKCFTGELLSLCFSDDPLATPGPARDLAARFTNASRREVREIDPRAFNVPRVSHVGFFHDQCRARLWPAVVDGFLS